jgi:FkbM family methyltransferase
MKLKSIQLVINHPLNKNRKVKALLSFFKRGLMVRFHKYPVVYPFVENTNLVVEKGMSSAELQIFCGLYDYDEMLLMMHFLREGDNFIDVGANVGVYSVLASGVSKANSYCFEPIPATFNCLKRNINYNNLSHKVTLFNNGVGNKQDTIYFTNNLGAVNHVVNKEEANSLAVKVNALDNFLDGVAPHFLKVDVEGFEAHVINGAEKTLSNPNLSVLLIETNGLTNAYDFSDNYIHEKLINYGFNTYSYNPINRTLSPTKNQSDTNTIYCRNIDFINSRLQNANKIKVFDTNY